MNTESSYQQKCVNSCPYLNENINVLSNDIVSETGSNNSEEAQTLENNESLIPYIFRINAPSKKGEARLVTGPPFYLQLDHALAVLWQLFEPNKEDNWSLGIGQLQWALYFLKAIKNPTAGTRSPDIELAIRAIEDALIEGYADMANVVMRSPPPQGIPCIICNLERNMPQSACQVCTSTSWGLLGQPRKSGRKEKIYSNMDFNYLKKIPSMPPKLNKQEQSNAQLRKEIEQLRNLAYSLSTIKGGGLKRKKVRVKSFAVPDQTGY